MPGGFSAGSWCRVGTATRLSVHVQPGAGRSAVVAFKEGTWHIRIAAPPVKGKANEELARLLSRILEIPKSAITVKTGLSGKNKLLVLDGITADIAAMKLREALEHQR